MDKDRSMISHSVFSNRFGDCSEGLVGRRITVHVHVDLKVGRPVLVEHSVENFVWDLTVSSESPGLARRIFGVGLREPSRIEAPVQPEFDTPESDAIDVAGVEIGASRSEFFNDPVCIWIVLSGDRIGGR